MLVEIVGGPLDTIVLTQITHHLTLELSFVGSHEYWLCPSKQKLREAACVIKSGATLIDVFNRLLLRIAGDARNLGSCALSVSIKRFGVVFNDLNTIVLTMDCLVLE